MKSVFRGKLLPPYCKKISVEPQGEIVPSGSKHFSYEKREMFFFQLKSARVVVCGFRKI